MTLLQAYLSNPSTRRVLSKRPGHAGFSLIELVVVVAVLAVLAVIAIPSFTSVSADAAHAAAKNTLSNITKECQVKITKGQTPTHASVTGSSGVYYSFTNSTGAVTGQSCGTSTAPTIAVACSNLGTAASYAINLYDGQKLAATTSVTNPAVPTGASACPNTATAW